MLTDSSEPQGPSPSSAVGCVVHFKVWGVGRLSAEEMTKVLKGACANALWNLHTEHALLPNTLCQELLLKAAAAKTGTPDSAAVTRINSR